MINRLPKFTWSLFFLLSISCISTSCRKDPKSISAIMEEWAKNGRREIGSPFNGAVLIAKNGQVHFKNAYGFEHRESDSPNSVQTKFPIGVYYQTVYGNVNYANGSRRNFNIRGQH